VPFVKRGPSYVIAHDGRAPPVSARAAAAAAAAHHGSDRCILAGGYCLVSEKQLAGNIEILIEYR